MRRTIPIIFPVLLLLASCVQQRQGGKETIDYVLNIAGNTSSPEYALLSGKSKVSSDGAIYILGSPETCKLAGDSFMACDIFENVRAKRQSDGLKDFSGETFSLVLDGSFTPGSLSGAAGHNTSLRERVVRLALSSLSDKCSVSVYDLEGNEPKSPAKVIILADPSMFDGGKFDIDTLFSLTSCGVPVVSPQDLLFESVFGGTKKYFNVGLMCDSLYASSGVYKTIFDEKVAQHKLMSAKYFENYTPADTLHRLSSFLDAYANSGRTEPLNALLIDDWRVDKRALLDELKLIRDFSREEFMRYGRLISPDFTIFSSSELTMKYCYLKLREMSLFTHRIAYPQIKSYTIKPLPGGSTLEFLMIPSENVQN